MEVSKISFKSKYNKIFILMYRIIEIEEQMK